MSMGSRIAEARRKCGMTQESLAEKVGVSFQAVSTWENDKNLPDTEHLKKLAGALGVTVDSLMDEGERGWELKPMTPDPDHMYTYIKAKAQAGKLEQTLKVLPFVREKHSAQKRKSKTGEVPYIVHPLTLACHALAMGIVDDDVIAALLLHDVIEDTGTAPEELPVSSRVSKAVKLVSYNSYEGDKETIKPCYYKHIRESALASLIKCIDRCNNLSCMADGFSRGKMASYVVQTEKYVIPLLDVVKAVPEWNNAAWLLRYQITALLETFKRLL